MSKKKSTKESDYFDSLKELAEAARKLEEARVKYDDGIDKLSAERRRAEDAFRAALERAIGMTGGSLPVSKQSKRAQEMREILDELKNKDSEKTRRKGSKQ